MAALGHPDSPVCYLQVLVAAARTYRRPSDQQGLDPVQAGEQYTVPEEAHPRGAGAADPDQEAVLPVFWACIRPCHGLSGSNVQRSTPVSDVEQSRRDATSGLTRPISVAM